jgi:hypothetical protein
MQAAVNKKAQEEGWSEVKRARACIAVHSVQKAAKRVARQKTEEKKDSLQSEEDFNLALSKEVFYEKVATEYGDANSVTRGVFSPSGHLYITVGSSG